MEDYYESARMLINLSGAVGRLVLAGREMTRLAGFTSRVTELMAVRETRTALVAAPHGFTNPLGVLFASGSGRPELWLLRADDGG